MQQEYGYSGERVVRVRSVDPVAYGKFNGVLGALIGFIPGAIFMLMSLVGAGFSGSKLGPFAMFGVFFGLGAIVIIPAFYGVLMFIAGVIGALFYNLVARIMGGIEITIQ